MVGSVFYGPYGASFTVFRKGFRSHLVFVGLSWPFKLQSSSSEENHSETSVSSSISQCSQMLPTFVSLQHSRWVVPSTLSQ